MEPLVCKPLIQYSDNDNIIILANVVMNDLQSFLTAGIHQLGSPEKLSWRN